MRGFYVICSVRDDMRTSSFLTYNFVEADTLENVEKKVHEYYKGKNGIVFHTIVETKRVELDALLLQNSDIKHTCNSCGEYIGDTEIHCYTFKYCVENPKEFNCSKWVKGNR